MFVRLSSRSLGRLAIAAVLFGCAPSVLLAQTDAAASNPLSPALRLLGLAPKQTVAAPDFVRRTEPATPQSYIPFNAPHDEPPGKTLTRDQILAEEAELEGLRARDAQRAGRKAVVVTAVSAAGPVLQPKKPKKAKPPCRMTCQIDLTKIGPRDSMQ